MKSSRKVLLALAAIIVLAGAAWAVTVNTLDTTTFSNTEPGKTISVTTADTTNYQLRAEGQGFGGTGTLQGSVLLRMNESAASTPGGTRVFFNFAAPANGQFAVQPEGNSTARNMYGVAGYYHTGGATPWSTAMPTGTYAPYAGNVDDLTGAFNQTRVAINVADTDTNTSLSSGMVILNGANGNSPIMNQGTGNVYNNTRLGTYVEKGTLATTHKNAAGLGGIALIGDLGVVPVLKIYNTDTIVWGQLDDSIPTNQPLVLARNLDRNAVNLQDNVTVEVEVDKYLDNPQRMTFPDGGWQAAQGAVTTMDDDATQGYRTRVTGSAAENPVTLDENGAGGKDARPAYPLNIQNENVQRGAFAAANGVTPKPNYFARLRKSGAGFLTFQSDGDKPAWFDNLYNRAYATGSYPGVAHFGGTDVTGGTLEVDGGNASKMEDRFKGSLGATWDRHDLPVYYANTMRVLGTYQAGLPAVPTATIPDGMVKIGRTDTNVAVGSLARVLHNPLTITNDGKVILNRSQVFTFFRGTEDTSFTGKQFTLTPGGGQAAVNLRPEIHVRLARQHSDFSGKMSGSFDLVLDSMETEAMALGGAATMYNRPGRNLNHIAQATLTLGNAENDIYGTTLVADGVLSVAGQESIGRVSLQVGETSNTTTVNGASYAWAHTETNSTGTFVGLNNATFTLPTRVESVKNRNATLQNGQPFNRIGALAAATGAETFYSDVTIDGGIEINPRAVHGVFGGVAGWADGNLTYPTWLGKVSFGVGEDDTYSFTGNTNDHTRIIVQRGTLRLGKYPESGFAEMRVRENATLELDEGVRDFSNIMDLYFEQDTRINVVLTPDDLATSRTAAMAKDAVLKVRHADYNALGEGETNRNRRPNFQLDLSQVGGKLTKGTWIKVMDSLEASGWQCLHFLREDSTVEYEDYYKVRITYENTSDMEANAVARTDQNGTTIFVEVTEDYVGPTDPTDPETPTSNVPVPTADKDAGTLAASAYLYDDNGVAVEGAELTFTLTSSNADDADYPKTLKAETNASGLAAVTFEDIVEAATYTLTVTDADGNVIGTRTITAFAPSTPDPDDDTSSGSSGCDAGFGAFALLALGAAVVLRKKD